MRIAENQGKPPTQSHSFYAIRIAFIAAVGGFLYGYDSGVIVGANLFLREQFSLSDAGFAFATSSMLIGSMTGPFLGGWLCDRIGRKNTFVVASTLLAVSAVFTAIPNDITTFNLFRFVGGIGVGLCSIASPMYIAEVAPAHMRGKLGLMYQLAIVVGALSAGCVSWVLAKYLPESVSWRWMFFSEAVAIALFMALLFFVPKSPRWLAEQGRDDEALRVLTQVDGPESASSEMKEIKTSLALESGGLSELLKPGIRKALLIGILLALLNNLTGFSAMSPYLPALFLKGGFPDKADAILQFIFVYGFMGLMTILSIWLVDRVGRRPLWICSSAFMFVALVITGFVFYYNLTGTIVMLSIFLLVIPHAVALGSLPWLMMSELYPTRIRAKAVAITTTFLWGAGFIGYFVFPIITGFSERQLGSVGPAFWLFAGVCVLSFVFGLKMLPETNGKTLEEIGELWNE